MNLIENVIGKGCILEVKNYSNKKDNHYRKILKYKSKFVELINRKLKNGS